MKTEYFYIDINLWTFQLVNHGISPSANHTGDIEIHQIHRIFLTKGQYNKFLHKL